MSAAKPLAERFHNRLACDVCNKFATGTVGTFPFYVCDGCAELNNSELIAGYDAKHSVETRSVASCK